MIFTTMCLALMFRKRGFAFLMICIFWGVLGTVNGVILLKRMTPFTLYDMQNTKDGFSLLSTYYSKAQITLGVAIIGVALLIVALYFINCYKWTNINYKKEIAIIAASFMVFASSTFGLIESKALSTFFGNLNYAYRDYGFAYCFLNTSVNKGIRKPRHYPRVKSRRFSRTTPRTELIRPCLRRTMLRNILTSSCCSWSPSHTRKTTRISRCPTIRHRYLPI